MTDSLKQHIIEFISYSFNRITQRSLENEFLQKYSTDKKEIRTSVRELVEENELIYTNLFGCSFLEKSFNKPVRVSKRIVLKPPDIFYQPEKDDIVINIRQGDAFGTGEHPTTRLALRGIEYLLSHVNSNLRFESAEAKTALDIGTGSGVLAIATVKSGLVAAAIGTEIDPCAVAEAKENVRLNYLEDKIMICTPDDMAETFHSGEYFSLILANLRYPTLKELYPQITETLYNGGYALLSGIKTDESSYILTLYTKKHFSCKWERNEKVWSGLLLERML